MLFEKPLAANEIVSIKFANGEEIICRLEEENETNVKFTKPLAVTLGPQGLGMMPWMFLANRDTFTVSRHHVMALAPAKKDAADQYLTGTTGIALA